MAYYTAAALRTKVATALDDTAKYPAEDITDAIEEFRSLIEESAFGFGVAFQPTTATETITTGTGPILLSHSRVTAVSSFAYTDGQGPAFVVADDLDFSSGWSIVRKEPNGQWWSVGRRVTVTYTHGYTTTPPAVLRACRLYVKNELKAAKSGQPAAVAQVDNDATAYSYRFETPGPGKPTRWPDVNAALRSVPNHSIPGMA